MVNSLKIKNDFKKLVKQMRKIGFTQGAVNTFLTETIEEVRTENKA